MRFLDALAESGALLTTARLLFAGLTGCAIGATVAGLIVLFTWGS